MSRMLMVGVLVSACAADPLPCPAAPVASACPECPKQTTPQCPKRSGERAPQIDAVYPADAPPLPGGLPLDGDMVTCDFRVFANGTVNNGNPSLSLSKSESPLVMTFAGLKSGKPVAKGNGGESAVAVALDNGAQIVLIERNGFGNVFTMTIARETGLAIWTKGYFMLKGDAPEGVLSIGRCY